MEFECKEENFSISWNSKEQILFIEVWGVHDIKTAELFMAKFREFYKSFFKTHSVVKVLIDTQKLIKTNNEARRSYTKAIKTFPGSAKIAIYGANIVIRVVTNFLLSPIIKRKNMEVKFLATVEEGLKWLKQDKTK